MDTLEFLVLGGLMGLLGQGARTVVGLKGMSDDAKALDLSPNDLFESARLFSSLMLGFLVGLAAALAYYLSKGSIDAPDAHVLLGFAASGYAGTDFLEGFISQYLPSGTTGNAAAKLKAQQAAQAPLATEVAKSALSALLTAPAGAVAVAFPYDQAEAIVLKVLADKGHPGVKDQTKLADIGYSNDINLYKLYAAMNQAIIPKGYAMGSAVVANWNKVSDIVSSVEHAPKILQS